MYYMMHCFSPPEEDLAMLSYEQDRAFRSWCSGARFQDPPAGPVVATVKPGYAGLMAEFWTNPVPLMTRRLLSILTHSGVDNLDTYRAEIRDPESGTICQDYVAFNIIGAVLAADLGSSAFDPAQLERKISMLFDAVVINDAAAHGFLLFRLGHAVNAIVVHEKVKRHIEMSGTNTLTFIKPEDWAG